jgi:hypothetical protein
MIPPERLNENISTAGAKVLMQLMIHGGFARLIMAQSLTLTKKFGLGVLVSKKKRFRVQNIQTAQRLYGLYLQS